MCQLHSCWMLGESSACLSSVTSQWLEIEINYFNILQSTIFHIINSNNCQEHLWNLSASNIYTEHQRQSLKYLFQKNVPEYPSAVPRPAPSTLRVFRTAGFAAPEKKMVKLAPLKMDPTHSFDRFMAVPWFMILCLVNIVWCSNKPSLLYNSDHYN